MSKQSLTLPDKDDELVLVVKTSIVVPESWNGVKTEEIENFEELVKKHGEFKRRGDVENDPSFKQIIPYMVFRTNGKYFLMQRTQKGGEARLHNLYTLGIGGHINKQDLDADNILEWGKREFEEEVNYKGSFKATPIGILNDESGGVSAVHLGFVILLEGDSEEISVNEDKLTGSLVTKEGVQQKYSELEMWSQIAFDALNKL